MTERGTMTERWWTPDEHLRRRPYLLGRNAITAAIRQWFAVRDFVAVEGAVLQRSPGNETHLHAFATSETGPGGDQHPLYLHTSPEFSAKKLIAAGEQRIVDIARVFRNRERSALHHPEFTMLEWYRAHEPYEALMEDAAALLALAATVAGCTMMHWRGRTCDPHLAPERLTVADAFQRHAGIDLMATISGDGIGNRDALAQQAIGIGLHLADDDHWSDIFSRSLSDRIEPMLGIGRATILCEYPASEAALARLKPGAPKVAERFELYACGVELANAFAELTDGAEQRRRFVADMDEKQRLYGERYPIDEDLIAALALMPPTSGAALGLDRLVMLAVGATRISDVIWTPVATPAIDEA